MSIKKDFYLNQANTIIKNLEKRNMEGFYCNSKEEAKQKVLELIDENSSVSWGGSMTLGEIDIYSPLKEGNYKVIDRDSVNTPEEKRQKYLEAFNADYYLMSTNAITLDGKLINIDGNGNRVAALVYGPKKVIIVAGMNKVCPSEDKGVERVRNLATPPNAMRVGVNTPCSKTGKCHDCLSDQTICCQILTTRYSKHPDRIKVILVGEELGY